jgi:mannose/fructose/N-acetylgalactosamine-specific phosphotransferase system component IID
MLGIVVFVLFSLTAKGNYLGVIPLALLYTALFVPFTYYIDRFAYRRYQARGEQGSGGPAKKR